ncbi:MAG: helix-turn-helix domain-containing protein [Solirubrobacterales bacterium]|nr:TetR/AcrR family transcriptional regulator [Solirubrobacterales bacterium]
MEPERKRGPGRPPQGAREAILAAARELFGDDGYEATTIDAILARSGVSRGALYHHFPGKLELFEAVYIETEDESVARLVGRAEGETPLEIIRTGSRGYLAESAGDSDFVRIGLTQARRVLGYERWRELAAERGVGVVEALIRGAIDAGEMAPVDPGAAASIWTAVLIEGGLMVVNAEDKQAAIEAAGEIFDRMLEGLAIAG